MTVPMAFPECIQALCLAATLAWLVTAVQARGPPTLLTPTRRERET